MSRFVPIAANACSTCAFAPFADRHHRDDRADADDDAERRQERAQLVAQQRAQRDAERLPAGSCGAASARRRDAVGRRGRLSASSERTRPSLHDDDARRVLGDVGLVRDEDDGDPGAPELLEERHHLDAGARVEVAGRLVGEDDLRPRRRARARSRRAAAGRPRAGSGGDRARSPRPTRSSASLRARVPLARRRRRA